MCDRLLRNFTSSLAEQEAELINLNFQLKHAKKQFAAKKVLKYTQEIEMKKKSIAATKQAIELASTLK